MRYTTICLFLFCCLSSFAQNEMPSEVYPLITQYEADRGSLQRFYFVPGSPERRERFNQFYKDYLSRLQQLPFESFSTGGKVDYIMMKRILENELGLLAQEEKEATQVTKLTAYANAVYEIEKKRRRGLHLKSDELAQQLNDIKKNVQAAQQKLAQEPNLTAALATRAAEVIGGQQTALKSVYEFYDGYDPQFTWWVKRPYQQLDSVLGKIRGCVKK
jgi:hypothetical protein